MKKEQPTSSVPLSVTLSLEEYQKLLDRLDNAEKQVAEKELVIQENTQTILENKQEIERLRWHLAQLGRLCWGRSSEKRRLPEDSSQLRICFEQVPDQVDAAKEIQKARKEVEKEVVYNRFRKSFKEKRSSHA